MADTSMTILSQDLFRISFLVQQAALQVKVFSSSILFFHKICLFFYIYNIVFNSFEFGFYEHVENTVFVKAIEDV